jgi:hypothetical protein
MAKLQNTSQSITNTFIKGLNKDSDPSFVSEGMWIHARNATNNTSEGNLGTLSNEASNALCAAVGTTMPNFGVNAVTDVYIIGAIHLYSDKWVIYSAGHSLNGKSVMSEIGLLEEERCIYRPIVQDECLGFDKRYLISGSSREREDCSWQVYWADGLNPDRFLNIGDPQTWPSSDYQWQLSTITNPTQAVYNTAVNQYVNTAGDLTLWPGVAWVQDCSTNANCVTCNDTNELDCDHIRLARLVQTPCLSIQRGESGGTLRNGTYFAVIAYLINGQRVTDYFSPSNTQPIYFPDDLQGAITINVEADQENFDEFVLVVVQNINQGTVAKQIGTYSTRTNVIELDQIKDDLITIPLQFIPITNPIYETSDQMTDVNNYLLRVGPRSRFDFNYQPLANLIRAKWVSIEYPADYYVKGGNKGSYLRDEVYAFFIRWVYNTGDKSASYHIPGRPPQDYTYTLTGTTTQVTGNERTDSINDVNTLTDSDQLFEMYNTANTNGVASILGTTTNDGGVVVASGEMGYWESSELYSDNRPDIWNPSVHCWTGSDGHASYIDPQGNIIYPNDLCGLNIRHHKFPDNYLNDKTLHYKPSTASVPGDSNNLNIRLMGVVFENIPLPKDNDGNDIPGIVGYEILRGSREGNKSIIAKGMLNNMRTYKIKGDVARNRTGLYPNYPFNCLQSPMNTGGIGEDNYQFNDPYIKVDTGYTQTIPVEINTFHSPDTMFRTPFLEGSELKLYGALSGYSAQQFKYPDEHPKFKLISDAAMGLALLIGFVEAIVSLTGKQTVRQPGASFTKQIFGDVQGTFAPVPPGGGTITTTGNWAPNIILPVQLQVGDPQFPNNPIVSPPTSFFSRLNNYFTGNFISNITGTSASLSEIFSEFNYDVGFENGGTFTAPDIDVELSAASLLESGSNASIIQLASNVLGALNKFFYYFSEGADATLQVIYAFLPFDQYALQMISHGLYDSFLPPSSIQRASEPYVTRLKIDDAFYIRGNIQEVPYYQSQWPAVVNRRYSINNLKRSDSVVLRTMSGPYFQPAYPAGVDLGPKFILNSSGEYYDKSLVTMSYFDNNGSGQGNAWGDISGPSFNDDNISTGFSLPIASHYGAIKFRKRNQYGQLESIKQIVITPCEQKLDDSYYINHLWSEQYVCPTDGLQYTINKITLTPIFFGGDTFVNRYTEKNSMFFFYDWLYGQPDGFEFNYLLRQMIPEPKFWVNSTKYDVSDFSNIFTQFFGGGSAPGTGWKPTQFYKMDYDGFDYRNSTAGNYPGIFRPKDCYFYLAASSVRDFFVESEVLVDFRIQGVTEAEKYYDPYGYTDIISMFNMDPQIITRGNEYRYDYSLSITKAFSQYFSSGNLQSRYYNPNVAKLCYTYYPDRIIYSLPQQQEAFKDSWSVFLVNNYKEFQSQISGVKSINKNGIVITFKNSSPLMYQGVDTLQTDLGTKITIGDGGLFSQPVQSVINSDPFYEYGSSQNRLSVISTPAGIYYISQNQAKIFSLGSNLKEISQIGLKWWFNNFLPYKLTDDFPDYPYQDNPVSGIGCQSLYDNENSILYFSKRDYQLLEKWKAPNFSGKIIYVPLITFGPKKGQGDYFQIQNANGTVQPGIYQLGNPILFEDASWTVSYDPKNEFWLSFHDWHPDLSMGTKDVFLTTKKNGIWKHNEGCSSFCNFYGDQYPFEIELPIITGQTVTTVKSIEYILECYRRREQNCIDHFHVLDYNFDKAIVYNSEQVSGYLNLNIFPKNNVTLSETYPKLNQSNLASFDILFSKEENKYRFNQFWDITRDRSEFPIGSDYPPTGPVIPGTTVLQGNYADRNIWFTESNGYKRTLNPTNLDYNKSELQRKKFRHYLNYLTLIKEDSSDTNMILKIVNSKNQISLR